MSERELMIGDWVQVPSESNRFKCIMSTFDLDEAPLYRPIPLTEEILEKNGWLRNEKRETWEDYDIEFFLQDGLDGNKFWWESGGNIVAPINYVHQLQHALRLCGINKEIEL